ncbi:DUF6970 domain-containing protein [Pontibacter ruber]|uniref:DUF6970 domain-containing protein n=1 Tax=Pontibacter ruber TaxID=1343895 RepID=A0ABW5CWA4_9BACT|nr:hypothetical protein [Pontibacter ruber]
MKKLTVWVTLLLLLSMAEACKPFPSAPAVPASTPADQQLAPWLTTLIQQLQEEKPANPPAKIYRYTYNNQEVYYLTGRCCDIPSKLFNVKGDVLCEPDGGITGKGDGKCPDFFEKRTNETLIWEDKRES